MKSHKEIVIRKVRQWLLYAEEDLIASKVMFDSERTLYRVAAYHAQQASEKSIKAYLVYHEIEFPYTHSIMRLLEFIPTENLREQLKEAAILTPYALSMRYPDDEEPVTEEEAKEAIEIATETLDLITGELHDL